MDFHTYTLNLYEQQPAFWADETPPEPRSYLCEARRRTILDRASSTAPANSSGTNGFKPSTNTCLLYTSDAADE